MRNTLKKLYQEPTNDSGTISNLTNYDDYLSSNTFLMAYSYLEEYLYLIWKFRAKEEDRESGFSINRHKPILKKLGVEPAHSSWQSLLKAKQIRDCLLHANGRLSFMTNGKEQIIRQLVREFQPALSIKQGDRLVVDVRYLEKFVNGVREFQNEIHATA